MKHLLILSALLGATCSVAQDEIHWNDGSVTKDCRIQGFDTSEITFRGSGSNQTKDAATVHRIFLGEAREVYRRGAAARDPGLYLNEARKLITKKGRDQLVAQFGFATAADLFYEDYGDDANAVASLAELVKAMPDSGYAPKYHRMKLTIYLSRGDGGNALSAAGKYKDAALTWAQSYRHEADFYRVLALKVKGTPPGDLETEFSRVARVATDGALNGRIQVEIAHLKREAGKGDDARKIYESIAKRNDVDDATRAGAYLGLGHITLDTAGANKEQNRVALLYFLRVVVETKDAWGSQKAEALFKGHEAAKRWGGERSAYMSGKLKYLLGQRYPDSSWAKKR